jgi:predicted transcriptional regulator
MRLESARVQPINEFKGDAVSTSSRRKEQVALGDELALVISHENTVKALIYLVERAGSPKEVGERLNISTSTASHHIKKLKDLNLVELLEEKEVGGTIQHIYRAVVRPIVATEEWEKLSITQRQCYSIWILRMVLADASRSFNARLFDTHPERHLSRTPMVVDGPGMVEANAILDQALDDLIQVEANSAARMVGSGDPAMNLIAAMMCFELPEPSSGLANPSGDRG